MGLSNGGNATNAIPAGVVKDYYISADFVGASDANPGISPSAPWQTLSRALQEVNALGFIPPDSFVVFHFATAAGGYTWPADLELGPRQDGGAIVFVGDGGGQAGDDGWVELVAPFSVTAVAGVTLTGSGFTGLTVDALAGKFLELQFPAYPSYYGQIRSNDVAEVIMGPWKAGMSSGRTVRVVEPGVRFDCSGHGSNFTHINGIGVPHPLRTSSISDEPYHHQMSQCGIAFIKIGFDGTTADSFLVNHSQTFFYACEFNNLFPFMTGNVACGNDYYTGIGHRSFLPVNAGLAIDEFVFAGAGLSRYLTAYTQSEHGIGDGYHGWFVSKTTYKGAGFLTGRHHFLGGAFIAQGANATQTDGGITVVGDADIVLGGADYQSSPFLFKINTGGGSRAAALCVWGGGVHLKYSEFVSGSVGIYVGPAVGDLFSTGAGVVSITDSAPTTVTIDAANCGIWAASGGSAYFTNGTAFNFVQAPSNGEVGVSLNSTALPTVGNQSAVASLTAGTPLVITGAEYSGTRIMRTR